MRANPNYSSESMIVSSVDDVRKVSHLTPTLKRKEIGGLGVEIHSLFPSASTLVKAGQKHEGNLRFKRCYWSDLDGLRPLLATMGILSLSSGSWPGQKWLITQGSLR
ncbi:hypothetical protein AVEN_198203-1 [Araneus ventricosus]|uniref:Uncharacterized protein n=1 Tax=Araneus ventricosus TaxID=182803 RepID=A0A4Y2E515_ARAVE|nr:hypothetical protein AVEN_198203-1 [Araneus ventricosus]